MKDLRRLQLVTKLSLVKKLLLDERDLDSIEIESRAIENEGYFDAQEYGNIDDVFALGKSIGKAQLIEELLKML